MPMVQLKEALPTAGALNVTISFYAVEIKTSKPFVAYGQSTFVLNVRKHVKKLEDNAVWNAIRAGVPNRTVTAYNIVILDYYYTYYLNNYELQQNKKNNKFYHKYTDTETKKTKKYVVTDKNKIVNKDIKDYKSLVEDYR